MQPAASYIQHAEVQDAVFALNLDLHRGSGVDDSVRDYFGDEQFGVEKRLRVGSPGLEQIPNEEASLHRAARPRRQVHSMHPDECKTGTVPKSVPGDGAYSD